MKELEYDEFEVLLERSGDGYTARVVESPTGPVPALPFVPPEPLGGLPALRLAVRGAAAPTDDLAATASPKQFGTDLFRALYNDKALAILRTSQYVAARRQRGLRLRIRFSDATPLANLPWELLYDPERHWYPCQLSRFPTIRFVDLPEPVLPLRVSGPLRMLVVISSPADLPELEVEREWTLLRTELDSLVQSGRLELERLPLASLEAVRETLMARDFHIFHYIGHGGVEARTGEGYLAFTGTDGRQRRVTGSQLGVMLSNSPIRLAVLNSCEGGRVSDVDPYASTAIALVEQGIPAVIAMQFQITDIAATAFSRTLYDSVTAGRPVDLAVTLARQAVLAVSEDEWATPVLYLRAIDGVLFDLAALPEPTAAVQLPVPPQPEPRLPEPPPREPPAVPHNVIAQVVDGVVDLTWQPSTEGQPVHDWEVWRDGALLAVVSSPAALDQPQSPGDHTYAVVARAADGARSPESSECRVSVPPPPVVAADVATSGAAATGIDKGMDGSRAGEPEGGGDWLTPSGIGTLAHGNGARELAGGDGGGPPAGAGLGGAGGSRPPGEGPPLEWHVRRRPRLLLLVFLLLVLVPIALVLWLITRPSDAPAAPTGVRTTAVGHIVTVNWDPAPQDGPAVDHWDLYRDAVLVDSPALPRASNIVPGAGSFTYTVVAVGDGGARSATSAPSVVVVTPTTSSGTSSSTSSEKRTSTSRPPTATADLSLKLASAGPGAGSGETDLVFRTDNLGPSEATGETVTVSIDGAGSLLDATVSLAGGPERQCGRARASATCEVGDHGRGLATVRVTVLLEDPSAAVVATTTSRTQDPDNSNNSRTYVAAPSSPPNS